MILPLSPESVDEEDVVTGLGVTGGGRFLEDVR